MLAGKALLPLLNFIQYTANPNNKKGKKAQLGILSYYIYICVHKLNTLPQSCLSLYVKLLYTKK